MSKNNRRRHNHQRRHHHMPEPMRPSWANYGWPWWWSYYSYPRYFTDWNPIREVPVQIREVIVKENNNTYLPLIISMSVIIIIALVLFK